MLAHELYLQSYRSLNGFSANLKETPMGTKHGFEFLQYMMLAFTIAGLFHPEHGDGSFKNTFNLKRMPTG